MKALAPGVGRSGGAVPATLQKEARERQRARGDRTEEAGARDVVNWCEGPGADDRRERGATRSWGRWISRGPGLVAHSVTVCLKKKFIFRERVSSIQTLIKITTF